MNSHTRHNRFANQLILVSFIAVLCVLGGQSFAQDFRAVHDGIEYAQVRHKLGEDPVVINLLRLDRSKVKLDVVHAGDSAVGLEKTSAIAHRRGAVAAINSGFFRLDKSLWAGDANGVLMIDGVILSESFADRTALFISDVPTTNLAFGRIRTEISVETGGRKLLVDGINRQRNNDEIILYDARFGTKTLTDPEGIEISVIDGKIAAITRNKGNSSIAEKGYVLSVSGKRINEVLTVREGQALRGFAVAYLISGGDRFLLNHVDDIVAGVPQLIKDGRVDITWEQEKSSKSFVETRHPRTAIARLKDGKFLMIAVDGRQPGVSVGMNLNELAEYLLSLGATDAMNLDGGGSTTMFVDGKVVNKPSDKEGERKVSDAILVTLRTRKN